MRGGEGGRDRGGPPPFGGCAGGAPHMRGLVGVCHGRLDTDSMVRLAQRRRGARPALPTTAPQPCGLAAGLCRRSAGWHRLGTREASAALVVPAMRTAAASASFLSLRGWFSDHSPCLHAIATGSALRLPPAEVLPHRQQCRPQGACRSRALTDLAGLLLLLPQRLPAKDGSRSICRERSVDAVRRWRQQQQRLAANPRLGASRDEGCCRCCK